MTTKMKICWWMIALTITIYTVATAGTQTLISSRAYSGHESDADANNFVNVYPATRGTRLDDCQTCHRAGVEGTDTEKEYNPCGYCHLLEFPNPSYKAGVPQNFGETLNAYGLAYMEAGRSMAALQAIANGDADGDGSSNAEEIAELRYPGDPTSKPGQPLAQIRTFSAEQLKALPKHEQFLLMNTTKQQFDDYAAYRGVKVIDVLAAAGVELNGAQGITAFAPDGFSMDYSLEEVLNPFPNGYFYAEPMSFTEPEKQFVAYPMSLPDGLQDGQEIPNPLWLMVAYGRDGQELDKAYYEKGTGRLQGEGPYRLVIPQKELFGDPAKPGRPDRGSKAKEFADGWDFVKNIDHNSGGSVRGVCVIRVNPMPAGYEEYDWKNGWALIEDKQFILYGYGVSSK
ncbi:hypothetical protein U27_04911 [Candidatus Vecturithrix granuli]|uniref:Uncharacterized protein n=1 Tax=Vecturithrix granuli TaxID=1499967 RepID=A0A081C034_VECG1|nr:hypothetical protein U27_04911 [Candidatus Vecturithrix granuli]